jgi:hypothetical protein
MFAGFEPPARDKAAVDFSSLNLASTREGAGMAPLDMDIGKQWESPRDRLLTATESYAKAVMDVDRMRGLGLPVVEHQKVELAKAGAALEAERPGSLQEFRSALAHDPATVRSLIQLQGPERAERLVDGMERERQAALDPNVRAERFVARWGELETEHSKLRGFGQDRARETLEERMHKVASEIGRDAQMESVLRARQEELGIVARSTLGLALRRDNVSEALEERLERGLRERGQDHGMEM